MTRRTSSIPNVLSIAGSDPSGGAGIQADLKTFGALGCHGMAAVTALTAQNTTGVSAVHLPPAPFVGEQIRMVFADVTVHAVKIGMLGARDIVEDVADALAQCSVPIVLDPVLVATSGASLGDGGVIDAMRSRLFPIVTVVTPNLAEASRLAGGASVDGRKAIEFTAKALRGDGAAAWLIKGGHGAGGMAEDYLIGSGLARWFSAPRIATRDTHGTGCTLSSAITAFLALGHGLADAVERAKAYVGEAIAAAAEFDVGEGPGPLDHFVRWR